MAVKSCTCKHKDQDDMNGKGKRVHNPTTKATGTKTVYRCTVCKKEE